MNRKQRKRAEIRRKQRQCRESQTVTAIVVKDRQWEPLTHSELAAMIAASKTGKVAWLTAKRAAGEAGG